MDTRLPISLFICKYITVCIIVINCVYWKSDFQNKSASAQFDDEFQSVLSFREPQLSCAMVYSYIYIFYRTTSVTAFSRGAARRDSPGLDGVGNWHRQMVPGSQTSFSFFFRVTKNSAAGLADEQVWASIFQLHPSRQQPWVGMFNPLLIWNLGTVSSTDGVQQVMGPCSTWQPEVVHHFKTCRENVCGKKSVEETEIPLLHGY